MNNKTKTSMILTTTMIALLAVMFAPSDAFADHWYGGSILTNGDAGFWFHCTSLDPLSVDWDTTNNCQKVTDSVEDSMSTYSNLGNDIDLTTTSTFTDYIVYATDLGFWGDSAQATFPNETGDYLRFNDWRNFGTSGSCLGWGAWNLEWLANHEFGHTVGLEHMTGTSVMVDSCASSWSDVQSHDEAVLDDKY